MRPPPYCDRRSASTTAEIVGLLCAVLSFGRPITTDVYDDAACLRPPLGVGRGSRVAANYRPPFKASSTANAVPLYARAPRRCAALPASWTRVGAARTFHHLSEPHSERTPF
jgi:hypothetical protein